MYVVDVTEHNLAVFVIISGVLIASTGDPICKSVEVGTRIIYDQFGWMSLVGTKFRDGRKKLLIICVSIRQETCLIIYYAWISLPWSDLSAKYCNASHCNNRSGLDKGSRKR